MKILRYRVGRKAAYGVLESDGSIRNLAGSLYGAFRPGEKVADLENVKLLAPVERPPKVIGVGLNYRSHIKEAGRKPPEFPMLFMKPSTAVIGPEAPIIYPRGGERIEFEGELVVIIGKRARRVPEDRALDYVLGYTCGNDVSARTIQLAEMAMGCLLVGKGFDTFCPLGPVIATGLNPGDLQLKARVNGRERQNVNTSDLLFSVAELVSYVSESITLLPGDVILTGTPAGVGPISPGDTVEIEISGIGVLRNPVKAEE